MHVSSKLSNKAEEAERLLNCRAESIRLLGSVINVRLLDPEILVMHRMPLVTPLVAGCLLVLGCDENPEPVAPDAPVALQLGAQECTPDITLGPVVQANPALPPLETLSTVVKGQAGEDTRFEFRFAGQHAPGTHTWFVRLRLREETLAEDVDIQLAVDLGANGELLFSVVLEPVAFGPPIVFNPSEPAELQYHLSVASDDALTQLENLRVFRQENEGDPYVCISSVLDVAESTITAELESNTRYALAIGR